MNGFRAILYALARLLGDINAVNRGTVGRRVERRLMGKVAGRIMGSIFK